MNIENIYDAISCFDEKYVSEADNIDSVRESFQKNRSHKIKTVSAIFVCAAVVIATGWIGSQGWLEEKLDRAKKTTVTQEVTTIADNQLEGRTLIQQTPVEKPSTTPANEIESRHSGIENDIQISTTINQNQQESRSNATQTSSYPFSTKITEKPMTHAVESTSVEASTIANREVPQNAYQDVIVNYETAKAYFMHPIISCKRNDFTGYSVLIYNPSGNISEQGTKCLSVTYLFTNGSVVLKDQDITGKVTPTGKKYEYQGKTFYVHTPEFNGDQIRIGYFPTGESGIAYQAHFNSGTDVNMIMDLLLSLEIR